jgi:uncharacterized protein (DUF1697 family)
VSRRLVLLRGVNVGGNKRVPMAELRDLLAGLGCTDVRTHLNSGNAVVTAPVDDTDHLAEQVEEALAEHLHVDVRVVVRTPEALASAVRENPLVRPGRDDSRLLVTFLKDRVDDRTAVDALDVSALAPDEFHLGSRELYLWYPHGVSQARLTLAQWERMLGTVGTARNWRTVQRLLELLEWTDPRG